MESMVMTPRTLAALSAILLAIAGTAHAQRPPPPGQTGSFTLVNRTTTAVRELFATPAGSANWGQNRLDGRNGNPGSIPPGGSYAVRRRADSACIFDLRVVFADGKSEERKGVNVCATEQVTIGAPSPTATPAAQANTSERLSSTGSGFIVAPGKLLTNNHVVDQCDRVVARTPQETLADARVEASDPRRDLALLSVQGDFGTPLTFRESPPVKRGEAVISYGFPLPGVLSSGPSLTTGNISALAGMRDNPLQYQISAPTQAGNSGGPLFDEQGHVVGITVATINALRAAAVTGGAIPQNVNFAVKGSEAIAFLAEHGVHARLASSGGPNRRPTDIGDIANPSTMLMLCYGRATVAGSTQGDVKQGPDDPSFRLFNRAAVPVTELYATPAGLGNWGQNRLGHEPLPPDNTRLLQLPRDGNCIYDLRVLFADKRSMERKRTNLCRIGELPVP
jgi:S1-C subfamily serine protease